jgi:hypothetical protein
MCVVTYDWRGPEDGFEVRSRRLYDYQHPGAVPPIADEPPAARMNVSEPASSRRIQRRSASCGAKSQEFEMPFSIRFARALIPAAIVAAAAPAAAAESPDMAKLRAHISSVQTMSANFVQTDARGRSAAGKLQLKRPGRVRFQYGSGDLLLVANGRTLTFLDYQVGQKSSWPLNRTPLGVLLSGSPDLKGRAPTGCSSTVGRRPTRRTSAPRSSSRTSATTWPCPTAPSPTPSRGKKAAAKRRNRKFHIATVHRNFRRGILNTLLVL